MNSFEEEVLKNWIDENGLVKAQPDWTTSGNGIAYSCIFYILSMPTAREFYIPIDKCIDPYPIIPGRLMRNPQNTYGQESWDDYLCLAVAHIISGDPVPAIGILLFGFFHFGFYCNDGFTFSGWLWRFPQVWIMMIPSAFRFTRWALWPLMWIYANTMTINTADQSGTQLQWVFLEGCLSLGFRFKKYDEIVAVLADTMAPYYAINHPFIDQMRKLSK